MSGYHELKDKQRRLRAGFPPDMSLRVHRALSWLQRAETAGEDCDAAFIFYWIAFNAAYADDSAKSTRPAERCAFEDFILKIIHLDKECRTYDAIWGRFPGAIRSLLNNPYIFRPFWDFHNGVPGAENWKQAFEASRRRVGIALAERNTVGILTALFDRLYVLRNQLVHGGATWNSSVNRDQLRDGVAILCFLLPIFIDLMMNNPHEDWGAPHYPVVDAP